MSLDFDFTDMIDRLGKEEFDRVTDHPTEVGQWHPVTNAIIWGSLMIDMGTIRDEAEADKFADRLLALQGVLGGDINTSRGPVYITRDDVHRHIGMRTNVSTKSVAAFKTRLFRIATEEAEREGQSQGGCAFDTLAKMLAEEE